MNKRRGAVLWCTAETADAEPFKPDSDNTGVGRFCVRFSYDCRFAFTDISAPDNFPAADFFDSALV